MNTPNLRRLITAMRYVARISGTVTFRARCKSPCRMLSIYAFRRDLQQAFYITIEGHVRCSSSNHRVTALSPEISIHFGLSAFELFELFGERGCGGATTLFEAAKYIENFIASARSQ